MPQPLKQSLGALEWHFWDFMSSLRDLEDPLDKAGEVGQIIEEKWLKHPQRPLLENPKVSQNLPKGDLLRCLQDDPPLLASKNNGCS